MPPTRVTKNFAKAEVSDGYLLVESNHQAQAQAKWPLYGLDTVVFAKFNLLKLSSRWTPRTRTYSNIWH